MLCVVNTVAAEGGRRTFDDSRVAQGRAYLEVLSDAWRVIAAVTVVAILVAIAVAMIPFFIEEGERMREEGMVYNFVFIVVWLAFLFGALLVLGRRVLGVGTWGEAQAGALNGALLFFSGLCLLLFLLYGSFRIEERHEEDGTLGGSTFSLLCLFLSVTYLTFGAGMFKYHSFVDWDISTERGGVSDDFVRMEENNSGKDAEWGLGWSLPWIRQIT